jgi:hypothetical protein
LFTSDLNVSYQPIDFINIPDSIRGEHRPGNMIAPFSNPVTFLMQYETCGTQASPYLPAQTYPNVILIAKGAVGMATGYRLDG